MEASDAGPVRDNLEMKSLREQLLDSKRRWEEFNRWEREEFEPLPITIEVAASATGTFYSWLSEEARHEDDDPEKLGFRKMQDAFARVEALRLRRG